MKKICKLVLLTGLGLVLLYLTAFMARELVAMESPNYDELGKLMDRKGLRLADKRALDPRAFLEHLGMFLEHYTTKATDEKFLGAAYSKFIESGYKPKHISNILAKLLDHLRLFYIHKKAKLNGIIVRELHKLEHPSYIDENNDLTYELSSFVVLGFLRKEKVFKEDRSLGAFGEFINGNERLKEINRMRLDVPREVGLVEYFYMCILAEYEFLHSFAMGTAP
jgi:hypothetical protein